MGVPPQKANEQERKRGNTERREGGERGGERGRGGEFVCGRTSCRKHAVAADAAARVTFFYLLIVHAGVGHERALQSRMHIVVKIECLVVKIECLVVKIE